VGGDRHLERLGEVEIVVFFGEVGVAATVEVLTAVVRSRPALVVQARATEQPS
jgi:hypothetical protein